MKEGNTKRSTAVWVTISGGVLIAAALIALYAPWFRACDVRRVVVIGNHHATAAEIVSLSGISRNQTIFSVPRATTTRKIEAHPWIRDAILDRIFPHTLKLEVEERQIVAWTMTSSDRSVIAVGDGGVLLEFVGEAPAVLELLGASLTAELPGGRLVDSQVTATIERLRDGICGLTVDRLDVSDLRSLELFLDNGPHVRLGALATVMRALDRLAALCGEIDISSFEEIDLRFGGEATLVP